MFTTRGLQAPSLFPVPLAILGPSLPLLSRPLPLLLLPRGAGLLRLLYWCGSGRLAALCLPPPSPPPSVCLSVCQPPAEAAALAARVSADADDGDTIVSDLEGIFFPRIFFLFVIFRLPIATNLCWFSGYRPKL